MADDKRALHQVALRPLVAGTESSIINALLCATDHGILMTDHQGTDVLCNPRFGELFDIDPELVVHSSREEVRRMALARVRDQAEFVSLLDRIYADPTLEHEDDIELATRPPRTLRRYTAPVYDADGQNIGRLWTFRDVTETRRLEAEVRRYAAKLEEEYARKAADLAATAQVLEAMTAISAALTRCADMGKLQRAVARTCAALLGHDRAAVLCLIDDRFDGYVSGAHGRAKRIAVTLSEDRVLAEITRNDAGLREYASHNGLLASELGSETIRLAPLRDRGGRLIGTLAMAGNAAAPLDDYRRTHVEAVSDQVALAIESMRLRGELQTAYDNLRAAQEGLVQSAKLGAVGTLAASIAHDIRNILTPLEVEMSIAPDGAALEAVRAQAGRLSALTYRLLALSRPAAIHRHAVDIREVLAHVVSLLQPQAQVDGIEIRQEQDADLPAVCADGARLEHLFINLGLNALAAMASKGGILSLRAHLHAGSVEVDVADTGPGIPRDHLERIFEPFFTTRANGTGLGLFSARRITEEHGGSLSVDSQTGKGTTFHVSLPLAE
jgi:signal transduction histidine kinase